jgi:hypothetical protein
MRNIFIIDWDDTLFPSSWVNQKKIDVNDVDSVNLYKTYFEELDKTIINFLNKLDNIGEIYIVTNANMKWIKNCLTILNNTRNFIISKNIRIVSARELYSKNINIGFTEWKIFTFRNVMDEILSKTNIHNYILNIISFGDANYEYIALINLDTFFKNKNNNINYLLKSIKFINKPNFNYIIEEINIVDKNLDTIINKISYVDIKFMN